MDDDIDAFIALLPWIEPQHLPFLKIPLPEPESAHGQSEGTQTTDLQESVVRTGKKAQAAAP